MINKMSMFLFKEKCFDLNGSISIEMEMFSFQKSNLIELLCGMKSNKY